MWDWLSGLGDWASQLLGDIISFLQWLLQVLIEVFQYIYALLVAVFQFFVSIFQSVWNFLKSVWNGFFKNIFTKVWQIYTKVHDWLEAHLKPILDFLKKVRALWDRWFKQYIKPILSLIGTIRKFLQILRAFGIKWAAELDKILGKVQADITRAFLKVQGYLNSLINIVNAISDPLGLLRRPTLVMSMRRIFPSWFHTLSGLPLGYFLPSPSKGVGAGLGPTKFPFNPSDPAQNPVASSYFNGDDGLGGFGGFDLTQIPPDTAADGTTALDYFNDDLYPSSNYSDPADALQNAWEQQFSLQIISS